jgi:hypothetical protein
MLLPRITDLWLCLHLPTPVLADIIADARETAHLDIGATPLNCPTTGAVLWTVTGALVAHPGGLPSAKRRKGLKLRAAHSRGDEEQESCNAIVYIARRKRGLTHTKQTTDLKRTNTKCSGSSA